MAEDETDIFGIPRELRNDVWLVALRARLITEQSHRAVERAQERARQARWLCARAKCRRHRVLKPHAGARVIRFPRVR
jgi:hypothetical protein